MATNRNLFSLHFSLISIVFLVTSCPNPCNTQGAAYYTEVPVTYSPGTDSIRLGDTLYLTSEFPSTFIPRSSSTPINYANAKKIANYVVIVQLTPGTQFGTDAVNHFDYVSYEGRIYHSNDVPKHEGVQQLTYAEIGDRYKLKVGLIPKVRGIYTTNLGVGLGLGKKGGDGCDKVDVEPIVTNTDIHKYFNDKFMGQVVPLPRKSVYMFKVY